MTKLKKYSTINEWNSAQESLKYPSIGYVNKKIKWMNGPTEVGDIAYWDGGEVKCVSKDRWKDSLGVPIGVVVIPSRIYGESRIIPINYDSGMGFFCTYHIIPDAGLGDYNFYPITDNLSELANSKASSGGRLPSDSFSGDLSYVDPESKYYEGTTSFIPSPYLNGELNPEYVSRKAETSFSSYNAMSNSSGYYSTKALVDTSEYFYAANACWNYSDGHSNLQYYLPSIGELGFLLARINVINSTLAFLGADVITDSDYHSSTAYSATET